MNLNPPLFVWYGPHVCKLSAKPSTDVEIKLRKVTEYTPDDANFSGQFGTYDNRRYLYNRRTFQFPTGLLTKVLNVLPSGTEVKTTFENLPVAQTPKIHGNKTPRYYQTEAFEALTKHGRGVAIMGTGTGKTLLCSMLAGAYPELNVLVTTPNIRLLNQNRDEMEGFLGEPVGILGDSKRELNARVVTATIQSLASRLEENDLEVVAFLTKVSVWICDESHGAAADSYRILSKALANCHIRLGTTATWMREDGCELLMEGVLGDVLYEYSYEQAFKDKVLTPIDIIMRDIPHIIGMANRRNKTKPQFGSWYRERIAANECRNLRIALDAASLVDNDMAPCLVMVKHIPHGKFIAEMLGCPFINGTETTSLQVSSVLKKFMNGDFPVIVASSILNVGVNLVELKSAVNAASGDSRIDALQKPGRGLRLHANKPRFVYVDYNDQEDFYFKWHAANRRGTYIKFFNKAPYKISAVRSMQDALKGPQTKNAITDVTSYDDYFEEF
jgi:superfamily II DNA or RNA helicase